MLTVPFLVRLASALYPNFYSLWLLYPTQQRWCPVMMSPFWQKALFLSGGWGHLGLWAPNSGPEGMSFSIGLGEGCGRCLGQRCLLSPIRCSTHTHCLCPGGSASHSARVCGTESRPWETYLVNSLNQVSGAVDVTVVLWPHVWASDESLGVMVESTEENGALPFGHFPTDRDDTEGRWRWPAVWMPFWTIHRAEKAGKGWEQTLRRAVGWDVA